MSQDLFTLVRNLVEIESTTENEAEVGQYLFEYLTAMCQQFGGSAELIEVAPMRWNVFAQWGDAPTVTFSTHMDTVPPYMPYREDEASIWGRGSCDAKGIMACMLKAIEGLLADGVRNLGMLCLVGEERNSAGARFMSDQNRGAKRLINGEPTSNRLALGTKGCLRHEVVAKGVMAHSAYPELGDSAINKLLDALNAIRAIELPVDPVLGPSTLNIGTISGGRAPNVISDLARAEVFIRLVSDGGPISDMVRVAAAPFAEAIEVLRIPAVHLGALDGLDTCIVAFVTDIPSLGSNWGTPYLIGPGTIHVAHTDHEHVPKSELIEAVEIYKSLGIRLLAEEQGT